jgi:hypothetical protein
MTRARIPAVVVTLLSLSLAGPSLKASDADGDKDKVPGSITVAFGTGLNNAQPGNAANHHIIPQEFKVRITKARKLDGTVVIVPATVNFVVAGFHWAWVYRPDVKLRDVAQFVADNPPLGPFINFEVVTAGESNVFAKGVFPGTPPAFADAAEFPLLSTQNRTDTFAFSEPGRYLVICNVRGHFIDGMYAWVRVVRDDDDDDDRK